MRKSGVMEPNITKFCIQRESMVDFTRTFQQKLHVTESMVKRLGMEGALEGHTCFVNCIEWSESGNMLASTSHDRQVILWDPFRRKKLITFQAGYHIYTMKFLPRSNDSLLVSGAGDHQVSVHNVEKDQTTLTCSCHSGSVRRIATTPSVPYMFWSASGDGTIMQFDLRTSHICYGSDNIQLINLKNHLGDEAEANCVAINPLRNELLAVGANDLYIRLYDRRMIKPTYRKEHASKYGALNTSENLDPACVDYFAAGHLPLTLARFEGKKNYRNFFSTYLTFGPNGRDLLVNMRGEQIYIFDVIKKRKPKTLDMSYFNQDEVNVPNDDNLLPTTEHFGGNGYSTVEGCNWRKNCSPTTGYSNNDFKVPENVETLKLHGNKAYDSERYDDAISIYNQAIRLCPNYAILYGNRAAAYLKRDWEGDAYAALRDCYSALAIDPDYLKAHFRMAKSLLELHCLDDALKCMTLFQNKFPSQANEPACIALLQAIHFLRDLAAAERGTEVLTTAPPLEEYWRENAYDYESRYCGPCNAATDIKEASFFGSDGQFVVAGSDEGLIFVWDFKTTNIMKVLRGYEAIVNCLQPHPTYCLLATSGREPIVRLWTPRPEDGSRNDTEILNLNAAAAANQKRLKFSALLTDMRYCIRGMRDDVST